MKKMETDLELSRVTPNTQNPNSDSRRDQSFIKLSNYKDGDDIAVYLKTFEKVRDAN